MPLVASYPPAGEDVKGFRSNLVAALCDIRIQIFVKRLISYGSAWR